MVGFNALCDVRALNRLERVFEDNLVLAVVEACYLLDTGVRNEITQLDAVDTSALRESTYVSTIFASTYEESANVASEAFFSNPSRWNNGNPHYAVLKLNPPIVSNDKLTGYVACAAAHDVYVHDGYVSRAGNYIPARPFFELTVAKYSVQVQAIFRMAFVRSISGY